MRDIGCKCPACLESERHRAEIGITYCYLPDRARIAFHLALHGSLPLIGILLIGWEWLALVPLGGFLAAYLFNSFYFCPSCAYHHGDERFCVCFPKSRFSFKQYRGHSWSGRNNLVGWPMLAMLMIGPTIAVLASRGETGKIVALFVQLIVVVFLMSVFSCPVCRQRNVCTLGKLTMMGMDRK